MEGILQTTLQEFAPAPRFWKGLLKSRRWKQEAQFAIRDEDEKVFRARVGR